MANRTANPALIFVGVAAILLAATPVVASQAEVVSLKSGDIRPDRDAILATDDDSPRRMVVRFRHQPGTFERGRMQAAGARIEAPLPSQAYLVTVPANRAVQLASIPGVDWVTPYAAEHKIAPDVADATGPEDIIVYLQLFGDADANAVALELSDAGLWVEGAGNGSRFDRVVLRMTEEQLDRHREALAERDDVFWIGRRYRRTLTNNEVVWVNQSGMDGGMTTPVHDQGIYGQGQIGAVLDTGIDADMCYFYDEALGLPPTNTGLGTTVDMNQRKVIAVNFLDPSEDPANPAHWDTQNHGSHVAGIMVSDDFATPVEHDDGDGMASGAKVVIQDAGYAADDCGDLPGIGCPVTDLVPIFQQAYDQGARVHNNSWNDNENAAVQNLYTDASEDVDEFTWNNPDFLILFGAGNQGYPAGQYGTIGSPGTSKNGVSVGGTYNGIYADNLADISSWGPTDDGRIKPEVLSPGQAPYSAENDFDVTTNNCTTRSMSGTSMASPGAAGSALLIRQYFVDGWYPTGAPVPTDGFNPTAALVKAMLVNSAVSIRWDNGGNPITIPHAAQGWGRVMLDAAMHFAGETRGLYVDEHAGFASPGDAPVTYLLEVTDASEPLEVTLAWTDYPSTPAATTHLVNDLDLRVDGDSGSFWGNSFKDGESWGLGEVDRVNNLEQVYVENPTPGTYSIQVSPHAVPSGPQPYALVVSGAVTVSAGPRPSYWSHTVNDSGPNGNGDGILDPGETATIPITLRNGGDADATSILANLYSSYPYLKVYGGDVTYPDIAVGDTQGSNAPHFSVTMEPAADCGLWVDATMGIEGDGFGVGSALTFETGVYEQDWPSTDTPITIPKSEPDGINSRITVDRSFPVTEVDVTLNIAHGDIGQLRVVLYAPDNTLVFLHDYGDGAGQSGIHTTYDDQTEPSQGSMDDFVGNDPQGTWRLKVQDNDGGGGVGDGTLQDWTLHFKSDIPFNCSPVGCSEGVPPAVADTLHVEPAGASDVQITWSGVGGASEYNVWRSSTKDFTKASNIGTTPGTSFTDAGAQTLPGAHYYLVRSVNACRWESP